MNHSKANRFQDFFEESKYTLLNRKSERIPRSTPIRQSPLADWRTGLASDKTYKIAFLLPTFFMCGI